MPQQPLRESSTHRKRLTWRRTFSKSLHENLRSDEKTLFFSVCVNGTQSMSECCVFPPDALTHRETRSGNVGGKRYWHTLSISLRSTNTGIVNVTPFYSELRLAIRESTRQHREQKNYDLRGGQSQRGQQIIKEEQKQTVVTLMISISILQTSRPVPHSLRLTLVLFLE